MFSGEVIDLAPLSTSIASALLHAVGDVRHVASPVAAIPNAMRLPPFHRAPPPEMHSGMSAMGGHLRLTEVASTTNPALMLRLLVSLCLACAACGPVEQPESAKTVAAYEVPLPTASERGQFLMLLSEKAEAAGFHVDFATDSELKVTSQIVPQTLNATVWRGKDDEEPLATAMDFPDRLGHVWIAFSLGEDPPRSRRFREALMPAVKARWPDTASLPVMSNGAIPLSSDLVRTPQGYIVEPSAGVKHPDQPER